MNQEMSSKMAQKRSTAYVRTSFWLLLSIATRAKSAIAKLMSSTPLYRAPSDPTSAHAISRQKDRGIGPKSKRWMCTEACERRSNFRKKKGEREKVVERWAVPLPECRGESRRKIEAGQNRESTPESDGRATSNASSATEFTAVFSAFQHRRDSQLRITLRKWELLHPREQTDWLRKGEAERANFLSFLFPLFWHFLFIDVLIN